jgi:uncharacterized protein YbjT (DUF2867 family)
MRVLVTGAGGLIGGAVAGALAGRGHSVVAASRPGGARGPMGTDPVALDFATATAGDWTAALAGVDAVVNCVGVLQASTRDSPEAAHARGPEVLFAACEAAGVGRVVHLSAVGVDRGARSSFSATKAAGDAALVASGLDWVILRPSVVLGPPVYGASALFRGLSALPLVPRAADAGPLQVVQLDDLVEAVLRLAERPEVSRVALEVVGPERLGFDEVVALYRRWHRWPPARAVAVPGWLFALGYRLGDLAAWLGWRPPMRSNARLEVARGAVGDPGPWSRATGIVPRRLADALAASPPSVQDRWFARLFLLKPVAFGLFALFWIVTGLTSIGPGYAIGVEYLARGGVERWAGPLVVAGGLGDLVIGIAIAFRRTARLGLYAALAVSLSYLAAGTAVRPDLWIDPLGALSKIGPIVALNLVCLAILEDR